jgi:large subunit ribosomal protein L20
MARVRGRTYTRRRRKRVLKKAKGYYGARSRLYKSAKETVMRALQFAYRDRRQRKRDFRRLWIVRINAACRAQGLTYSQFVRGLKAAAIPLDRKAIAALALHDPQGFAQLVEQAKAALESGSKVSVAKS